MFMGNYEFGRGPDKQKRKGRGLGIRVTPTMNGRDAKLVGPKGAAKIQKRKSLIRTGASIIGGGAVIAAGIKNRKGIGNLVKGAGSAAKNSKVGKTAQAGYKSGTKGFNSQMRGGAGSQAAATGVRGAIGRTGTSISRTASGAAGAVGAVGSRAVTKTKKFGSDMIKRGETVTKNQKQRKLTNRKEYRID